MSASTLERRPSMALASEAGAGSSDKNFGSLLRQLSTGGTVASGTDGASSPGTQAVRSPRGRHNPATLDLLTTGGNDNPAGRAAARRHFQKELAKTQDPLVTSRIKVILQRLGDMALLANRRRSQSAAAVGIPVGSGLKGIRESSAQHDRPDDAADSVASSALGGAGVGGGQPQRPGHAGHLELLYGLTTTELLLVELDASVSHLCDAFHQLPEDLRRLLCAKLHLSLDVFKADQYVYNSGYAADKFYFLLQGAVDVCCLGSTTGQVGSAAAAVGVSGHQAPRTRSVIATITRGGTFGEQALLLKRRAHYEAAIATTNSAAISVPSTVFHQHLAPLLMHKVGAVHSFLRSAVSVFVINQGYERALGDISKKLHLTTHAPGTEWEPARESQLYFVAAGEASMVWVDKKTAAERQAEVSRRLASAELAGDATVLGNRLAAKGPLGRVEVVDGQLRGTLGLAQQLRREAVAAVPRKTIGTLGPGAIFGGGTPLVGDGEYQSSLLVVATSQMQLYHCGVDDLLTCAPNEAELLNDLRNNLAFCQTYAKGKFSAGSQQAAAGGGGGYDYVGHREADMAPKGRLRGAAAAKAAPLSAYEQAMVAADKEVEAEIEAVMKTLTPESKAILMKNSRMMLSEALKGGHVPGEFSPAVARILKSLPASRRDFEAPPSRLFAVDNATTPTTRYWAATALVDNGNSNSRVNPLLQKVYPNTLTPLVEKLQSMDDRIRAREMYEAEKTHAEMMASQSTKVTTKMNLGILRIGRAVAVPGTGELTRPRRVSGADTAAEAAAAGGASSTSSVAAAAGLARGAGAAGAGSRAGADAPALPFASLLSPRSERRATANSYASLSIDPEGDSAAGGSDHRPSDLPSPAVRMTFTSLGIGVNSPRATREELLAEAAARTPRRAETAGPRITATSYETVMGPDFMPQRSREGSLLAAAVLWERTSDAARYVPDVRQTLTSTEIATYHSNLAELAEQGRQQHQRDKTRRKMIPKLTRLLNNK